MPIPISGGAFTGPAYVYKQTPDTDLEIASKGYVDAQMSGGGFGSVTSVSVATANGFSGTVANASSTPDITIIAGAITPTSVAATGNVTGLNLSGTNTGDQDLSGYVPTTRTVNGHALSSNVTVSKSDVGLSAVTNDAQVKKAGSSTDGVLPKWSGTSGDAIVDGYSVTTSLGSPGSNTVIPTELAVRTALSSLISISQVFAIASLRI